MISFDWNLSKNKANFKKHGILFNEALMVFYDPNHIKLPDLKHSSIEDRFNIIGATHKGVLFVVYVIRKSTIHRIISARKVTKKERVIYEEKIK